MDTPAIEPVLAAAQQTAPRLPRARRQKIVAPLGRTRKVVTEGVELTMEAYVEAIEELLTRARAARRQAVALPTFLAILRDQAGR